MLLLQRRLYTGTELVVGVKIAPLFGSHIACIAAGGGFIPAPISTPWVIEIIETMAGGDLPSRIWSLVKPLPAFFILHNTSVI